VVFKGLSLQETSWRGLVIITATGELTADTAGGLRERLSSVPSEVGRVVLDLRGLVRIDRAGVQALSEANADALASARELLVVRPSSRLVSWRRPPGMVGPQGPSFVDDLIEVFESASSKGRNGGASDVSH
jgi:anti-anti-sigma regulatory factor